MAKKTAKKSKKNKKKTAKKTAAKKKTTKKAAKKKSSLSRFVKLFGFECESKEAEDILKAAIKQAAESAAKEGKQQAAAQIEKILRNEVFQQQANFNRVTTNQLSNLTGKTRQTIFDWFKKHDLPRNPDQTYDLEKFIPWFEDFIIKKINQAPGRFQNSQLDPLKARKAEKLEIELAEQKSRLLDRDTVIAGIIARYQQLVNTLNRKASDLAMLCHGQPAEKIAEILNEFFGDIRKSLCTVPQELRLSKKAEDKLQEAMEIIESTD